ncbi:MAG: signal peptide peptidase SppA [Clostridiales bacterium]|nr:signal peptide peptidase SppA [Clostridiales bacterium]
MGEGTDKARRHRWLPKWARAAIVVICAVVLAFVIVAAVFAGVFDRTIGPYTVTAPKVFAGPASPYIAKISVVGSMGASASRFSSSDAAYHHAWTLQTIDTLIKDDNNQGIYLWLNTPGGTVYEVDELYLKLMDYKEQTGRPVYAYMTKMAASGGYYAAMAADEVYANRNAWTGSIGVTIGTLFDVSRFLSRHGIETETITSGRNKAMGNYYEPLTDEQRDIFQSLVDDAFDRFVRVVMDGRGMSYWDVRPLADGRLYTAGQALDAGLLDELLGEQEAEEAIKGKFDEEILVVNCYFRPDRQLTLFGFPLGAEGGVRDVSESGDVAAVLEFVRDMEGDGLPPLKYLYGG